MTGLAELGKDLRVVCRSFFESGLQVLFAVPDETILHVRIDAIHPGIRQIRSLLDQSHWVLTCRYCATRVKVTVLMAENTVDEAYYWSSRRKEQQMRHLLETVRRKGLRRRRRKPTLLDYVNDAK